MKISFCLLALLLIVLPGAAATPTNLVELLRETMARLDAEESGTVPPDKEPAPPPQQPKPETLKSEEPTPPPASVKPILPSTIARLAPGDLLNIEVIGEPEMSTNRIAIAEDGTIRLPLVEAPLKVGGLLPDEAQKAIHKILSQDYLVNPEVRLTLIESTPPPAPTPTTSPTKPAEPAKPAPSQPKPPPTSPAATPAPADDTSPFYTITGQIKQPDRYTWKRGETMTIYRAIGQAGGATRNANLSTVTVRRVVNGEKRELVLDLSQPGRDNWTPPLILQPGDEVEVPRK